MRELKIQNNEAGQRLDKLLMKYLNQAPASFVYKMLRKKNITLNDKKADGLEKLVLGDCVKLYLSEETIEKFQKLTYEPLKIQKPLSILYEDSHICIINKEAGILSQKSKPEDISLIEYIISYLLEKRELTQADLLSFRPGLCNRLDRNTSGIIIAGKSLQGLQQMADLLKKRSMDKYYYCITKGVIEKKQTVKGYLYKSKTRNKVTITTQEVPDSSYICTEYEPIRYSSSYTLLKVKLITGRSHQIRAHLQSIGHPIIGDGKYGDVLVNQYFKKKYQLRHQLLHAYELVFPKLEQELSGLSEKKIIAPLPEYFKMIIEGEFDAILE